MTAVLDRWRRELLLERICQLNDAKMNCFTDNDGMFHGSPEIVHVAIKAAIVAFEDDDFDRAEAACVKAEQIICAKALPHPPRPRPRFGMARPAP